MKMYIWIMRTLLVKFQFLVLCLTNHAVLWSWTQVEYKNLKQIPPLPLLAELPGLHSTVVLSSASPNSLTIRFVTWAPQNGGGSEPQGYHVEMRNADVERWSSGPDIYHHTSRTVYTVLLENLQPHTSYFVRVIPFIRERSKRYYGSSTQEGGPFSTGRWLAFTWWCPD